MGTLFSLENCKESNLTPGEYMDVEQRRADIAKAKRRGNIGGEALSLAM